MITTPLVVEDNEFWLLSLKPKDEKSQYLIHHVKAIRDRDIKVWDIVKKPIKGKERDGNSFGKGPKP